jgi:hypothetical protein
MRKKQLLIETPSDRRPARALRRFVVLSATTFAAAMLFASSAFAQTIASDRGDYAPGETVVLSGDDWAPGEEIEIHIEDSDQNVWSGTFQAVADANGDFSKAITLPNVFVAIYNVVAVGSASNRATASFEDSAIRDVVVSAQAPASINPGGTATYSYTVFAHFGRDSESIEVELTTAGLPAGTSAVFIDPATNAPVTRITIDKGNQPGANAGNHKTLNLVVSTTTVGIGEHNFSSTAKLLKVNGAAVNPNQTVVRNSTLAVGAAQGPLVVVDTTAPDAPTGLDLDASSDIGLSNTDNITNATTLTINGSAEPGSTVKIYNGAISEANLVGTATAQANGSFSITTNALPDGNLNLNVTATDAAGNVSGAATINVTVDTIAPSITGSRTAANAHGWNNTDVVVHFDASDNTGGSGIASVTPDVTVSAEGAGQSETGTATDVAGNSAQDTVGGINIDKTKPVITITGDATTLCANAPTHGATDALSGVDSQGSGSLATAQLSGVGSNTFSVTGVTDKAGNTATASKTYNVIYGSAFSGIQQPINVTGPLSIFKLGSTIPVKFTLTCGGAPITNAVANLRYIKTANTVPTTGELEAVSTSAATTGTLFRLSDATTGQYIFNLSTKSTIGSPWSEGTYLLQVTLDDGSPAQTATISIKK